MPAEMYKGVRILVEFRQAKSGGWAADFTLERKDGTSERHSGAGASFPTSELALNQALKEAKRIVDCPELAMAAPGGTRIG